MFLIKAIIEFFKRRIKENKLYKIDKARMDSGEEGQFFMDQLLWYVNESNEVKNKAYKNDYADRYCRLIQNQFLSQKMAKKQIKRISVINEMEMANNVQSKEKSGS